MLALEKALPVKEAFQVGVLKEALTTKEAHGFKEAVRVKETLLLSKTVHVKEAI